jgi:hypothetical protein
MTQSFLQLAISRISTERGRFWYAVADAAQHRSLPAAITTNRGCRCLFGASEGSPLAAKSPHLVPLAAPSIDSPAWHWINRHAKSSPCVIVMQSSWDFEAVYERLRQLTQVAMPDGEDMNFAFWDPAILGTLVGQADDETLHVPGPVLEDGQRQQLLGGIDTCWYWDREGGLHEISGKLAIDVAASGPLTLSQTQVDALVEASVPDHVLHYIELNQPHLLQATAYGQRYRAIRAYVQRGRELNLVGMGDLVNFACAGLIYGAALDQDPLVCALLASVSRGTLTLTQALDEFP